ncbi:MAG: hypothetical protein WCO28_01360 [Bacteroidota bacterium]
MLIERKNKEVVITLSSSMSAKSFQQLVDYLRYIEIAEKSKAKKTDLQKLVATVKKSRHTNSAA